MTLIAFLLVCSAFAATLQPNGTISIGGQPTNITLAANQYTWLTINLNSVGANQGLRVDVQEGDSVAMGFRWTTDFSSDDNLREQADDLQYGYNFGGSVDVKTLIIPACAFVSVAPNNKNGNLVFGKRSGFGFGTTSMVSVTTFTEECTSATWSSTEVYAVAPYSWKYLDAPFTVASGSSVRWTVTGGSGYVKTYSSYVLSEYPDLTYPTGSSTYDVVYLVKPQMTIRLGLWNSAATAMNVSVTSTLTPQTCYVAACTGSDSDAEDCDEVSTCVGAKEYTSFPFDSVIDFHPRDGFYPLIFMAIQGSAKCRQGLANQMCVGAYTPCDENNFLRPLCAEPFCNDLSGCTFKSVIGDSQTITYPNLKSNMTQCLAYLNRGGNSIDVPDSSSGPAGRSPPMNFVAGTDCYVPPNAHVSSAFVQGVNRLLIGASILLALSLF